MSKLKVRELAYVRLRSPDLDEAEQFLTDFGLLVAERTDDRLYMRGTGPAGYIHVTEKGPAKFLGFAFAVASEADLLLASEIPGASAVEEIEAPGGGKRVVLVEPNGYQVEIVWGIATLPSEPVAPLLLNSAAEPLRRAGTLLRHENKQMPIHRIGHIVMGSPINRETTRWFHDNLGLIASDELYADDPDDVLLTFSRLDCDEEYVDHHVFVAGPAETAGLNHVSFEVAEIEAVFFGHEFLKRKQLYTHMWGTGRHLVGSQVYDYWSDPWGRVHERWADSDRLNATTPANRIAFETVQDPWGEPIPEVMATKSSP